MRLVNLTLVDPTAYKAGRRDYHYRVFALEWWGEIYCYRFGFIWPLKGIYLNCGRGLGALVQALFYCFWQPGGTLYLRIFWLGLQGCAEDYL